MFMVMFADDIALISDNVVGLQKQINILYDFSIQNKLCVNISKTKVMALKKVEC